MGGAAGGIMTTETTPMRALHARLQEEHGELDAALQQLLAAFETGDQDVARDAFRAFDRRLALHLRVEDELLLPDFAEVDPIEAAELARDHRLIRAKADELAVGSDLHLARVPAVRELGELLRAHADREDQLLYRWVEQSLEGPTPELSPAPAR